MPQKESVPAEVTSSGALGPEESLPLPARGEVQPSGEHFLVLSWVPFLPGVFPELTLDATPSPPELRGDQASAHLLTVFQGGVRPFCLCSRPNTVIVFGYGGEVSDRREGGLRHSRSFHMQGSCPCSALHILGDATALWASPAPRPVAY